MIDNVPIEEIVKKHFYTCTKRTVLTSNKEHYVEDQTGKLNYNEKYKILFPHETTCYDQDIEKYIRRFQRLKNTLLSEDVTLVYASQSSQTEGNYLVDNEIIIKNTFQHLLNIVKMLNVKMIVFDTLNEKDPETLKHPLITLVKIQQCRDLYGVIDQVRDYFDKNKLK